jgi:hypothetical protein
MQQQEQQRSGRTFDEMAAWLLELERRLRVLEAENQELRRQLTDLRRGVGIALVIEGRTVPVAPLSPITTQSGPVPAVGPAHTQTGPGEAARALDMPATPAQTGTRYPSFGPLPPLPDAAADMARSWPGASRPIDSNAFSNPRLPVAPSQPEPAPARPPSNQHLSWPPAATTAHLPVVRPLSAPLGAEPRPESHAAWLRAGSEWPDQAATRPVPMPPTPPAPLAPFGQNPSAPHGGLTPPERSQNERQPGERNPFADSFIL